MLFLFDIQIIDPLSGRSGTAMVPHWECDG